MRAESTGNKGMEIPCQNTFKDKPPFRFIGETLVRTQWLSDESVVLASITTQDLT